MNSSFTDRRRKKAPELPECFICRDVQLVDGEALRRFCDCKSLFAHHDCLVTWIRTGPKNKNWFRCRLCKAKYQQRNAPWWTVASQWYTWIVMVGVVTLAALVPYIVYRMLTDFDNPAPHELFKTAAICFGVVSETLLFRFLWCYMTSRYRQAQQTSFSLQPRKLDEEQEAEVKGHGHQADALWQ